MALNAEEDRAISRLWKISRTVHEMVRDRVSIIVLVVFSTLSYSLGIWSIPRWADTGHRSIQRIRCSWWYNWVWMIILTTSGRISYSAILLVRSRNRLNFFTNRQGFPEEQIFVFFADEKNVSVKLMRRWVSILIIHPATHLLLSNSND